MKKIIIILLIASAAAASGIYFYVYKAPVTKTAGPEHLLPSETLAFIQVKNLEKKINKTKQNRLGKNLQKIDIVSVSQKLGIPDKKTEDIQNFLKTTESKVNKEAFFNLFGKNFTIAVTSPSVSSENKKVHGLVFLFDSKTDAKLTRLLSKAVPDLQNISEHDYQGSSITESTYKDNITFFHFIHKDFLAVASSLKTAQQVISTQEETGSLAQTEKFKNLDQNENKEKQDFFVFLDTEGISGKLTEFGEKFQIQKILDLKNNLNNNYIAASHSGYSKSDSIYETISEISMKEDNYPSPEKAKSFLSLVPKDIISFAWQNNFDLKEFLKNIFPEKEKLKNFENKLYSEAGIDAQTLYNNLSGKAGFIFENADTSGMFPVPEAAFIFNEKAGDSFDEYFAFLQEKQNNSIQVRNKEVGGYSINFIPLPLGKALEPSWGYIDDKFVLAVNSSVIENMINSEESVKENKFFRFVKKELPDKYNSISFFNTAKFSDTLLSSGDSLLRLAAFKSPELTQKGNIILTDILTPALEGLSMYEATGRAGFIKNKKLKIKSVTKITQ
ncbi:MAG: DUF3352 domain-containing protein [Thermodesulfobacteriota bacterium]